MIYNDSKEKSFDRQLKMSYSKKYKSFNISNKLSYHDRLTITTMNEGKRTMTIEDWINNDPEALYNHAAIKRKVFIAGAIFDKLKKKLNIE
jgi:hypothetical protein